MVLQETLARCFLSAKDDGCVLKLGIICVQIFFLKSWATSNPGLLSFTRCRNLGYREYAHNQQIVSFTLQAVDLID